MTPRQHPVFIIIFTAHLVLEAVHRGHPTLPNSLMGADFQSRIAAFRPVGLAYWSSVFLLRVLRKFRE